MSEGFTLNDVSVINSGSQFSKINSLPKLPSINRNRSSKSNDIDIPPSPTSIESEREIRGFRSTPTRIFSKRYNSTSDNSDSDNSSEEEEDTNYDSEEDNSDSTNDNSDIGVTSIRSPPIKKKNTDTDKFFKDKGYKPLKYYTLINKDNKYNIVKMISPSGVTFLVYMDDSMNIENSLNLKLSSNKHIDKDFPSLSFKKGTFKSVEDNVYGIGIESNNGFIIITRDKIMQPQELFYSTDDPTKSFFNYALVIIKYTDILKEPFKTDLFINHASSRLFNSSLIQMEEFNNVVSGALSKLNNQYDIFKRDLDKINNGYERGDTKVKGLKDIIKDLRRFNISYHKAINHPKYSEEKHKTIMKELEIRESLFRNLIMLNQVNNSLIRDLKDAHVSISNTNNNLKIINKVLEGDYHNLDLEKTKL